MTVDVVALLVGFVFAVVGLLWLLGYFDDWE